MRYKFYEAFAMMAVGAALISLLAVIVLGKQILHLSMQPTVAVTVEGHEVFRGNNTCVDQRSMGSATQVQIYRGFLCLIPGPTYTAKDVTVLPVRENAHAH